MSKHDPRVKARFTAKRDGVCWACGAPIWVGQPVALLSNNETVHDLCACSHSLAALHW